MHTPEQEAKVVILLQAFEDEYLGNHINRINPFRRPGVVASDIAYQLGLTKYETTKTGRLIVDTKALNTLIKSLMEAKVIELVGSFRTLQAGSKNKKCYALMGFSKKAWE